MSHNHATNNGTCEACGLRSFERNIYFDGKLLVTRDFQSEQAYMRGKDQLHNSLLHGFGTVCGLKITQHPNPACRAQYVVLNPGLALDCCGHELVVHEQQIIDLRAEIETALSEAGRFPEEGDPELTNVYVRLAYRECETEPVPALLDDCGCNGTDTEFNRTRESYRLFVDLEDPISEAIEPLDARLEWQHTLSVASPQAIVIDRERMRLYVAEYDGTQGLLRMYDANTHSQMARVTARGGLRESRRPTALARSNLGDYIYVAIDHGATVEPYIAIFNQHQLETDPDSATGVVLSVPAWTVVTDPLYVVRLGVSSIDDNLFALISDGRILRWSRDAIRTWVESNGTGTEPVPITQYLHNAHFVEGEPLEATVRPSDMTLSLDGRWLVAADGTAATQEARLIVVNLSQFDTEVPFGSAAPNLLEAHALPAGDIPSVVEFSYDGAFLYVLCSDSQMLYRIEVRDALDTFIPDIPDEGNTFSAVRLANPAEPNPEPVDIDISPRDNWIYVLRRLFDSDGNHQYRGEVLILSVDAINQRRGPTTVDLETSPEIGRGSINTQGDARFENLAFLGQRLYVAGEMPLGADDQPQGSISILYVDEAACDAFIHRTIEGCPTCEDHSSGVILASIQNYDWDQPIVEDASAGPNVLDNLTHRPMAPSTDTLRQVIECMLEKGISEGIPGPRGSPGPRGPGIMEASATSLAPDQPPTVTLEPIPGDPEGDQRLLLGIPRGLSGDPGARGPGITEVSVTTLPPGTNATAALEPIPGDPEGDQRLLLGIPRGEPGQTAPPEEFTRLVNANWHHDEIFKPEELTARFGPPDGEQIGRGLIAMFERPVRAITLNNRSAFVLVRRRDEFDIDCDCAVPMIVEPVDVAAADASIDVTWLIGDTPTGDGFKLVQTATPSAGEFVNGVRLNPADDSSWNKLVGFIAEFGVQRLTVVLRGDWILDEENRGVDGNHIWPGVPEGPTAAGVDGRPSGNGTEGGDWISVIHIDQGQFG